MMKISKSLQIKLQSASKSNAELSENVNFFLKYNSPSVGEVKSLAHTTSCYFSNNN